MKIVQGAYLLVTHPSHSPPDLSRTPAPVTRATVGHSAGRMVAQMVGGGRTVS